MGFQRLRFFNFRNLKDRELAVEAPQVFLVGPNGQGKTNLLEAIHLLCLGSSFREKRESALRRDPAQPTGLFGSYHPPNGGGKAFRVVFGEGHRKELRVDERLLSDRRGLLSEVRCLCFVQEDLQFIMGPPEQRRRFFDQTLVLCDPTFLDALRGYRQVLRSRNACLRQGRENLLELYDPQLALQGLVLQERREALIREFDGWFSPLLAQIAQTEPVAIRYAPSWEGLRTVEEVVHRLQDRRGRDRLMSTTTSGPHRDLCSYVRGGREYAPYASTGQLRLCALALRVAQARYLTDRTGRLPVLLVDDVLLELDPARRAEILGRFPPREQAFFTFLPDESWQALRTPQTQVLEVQAGDFLAFRGGD